MLNFSWITLCVLGFLISFELKYDSIGITFLLLTFQSATMLYSTLSRKVTLLTVYSIFSLTFLSLIPWLHYSDGRVIWRMIPLSSYAHFATNISIFLANIIIFLAYSYSFRKSSAEAASNISRLSEERRRKILLLSLSIFSLFCVYYINNFSINLMFFRDDVDIVRESVSEYSSISIFLTLASRLIPVFCLNYALTNFNNNAVLKIILFLIVVICVFPTGVPRYMVAFVYIPLALLVFPSIRNSSVFSGALIVSIIFIFPFLNQFRNFRGFGDIKLLPSVEFFYAPHFDAYENFASAIDYDFITYGRQLMGAVLFFVPRIFFPDKPIGSGAEMANTFGYVFNNISMPFLAEGFVNFGYFGIFLFAISIGYVMGKMDKIFSLEVYSKKSSSYSISIYFFLIGALMFILRGDMLSSFSYTTAGVCIWWMIGRMMKVVGGRAGKQKNAV